MCCVELSSSCAVLGSGLWQPAHLLCLHGGWCCQPPSTSGCSLASSCWWDELHTGTPPTFSHSQMAGVMNCTRGHRSLSCTGSSAATGHASSFHSTPPLGAQYMCTATQPSNMRYTPFTRSGATDPNHPRATKQMTETQLETPTNMTGQTNPHKHTGQHWTAPRTHTHTPTQAAAAPSHKVGGTAGDLCQRLPLLLPQQLPQAVHRILLMCALEL